MEEKDRIMLKEALELSRENNKMLQALYRNYWWRRVWRIIYWAIIIALILGGYIAIKPYLGQFGSVYDKVMHLVGSGSSTSTANR